MICKRNVCKFSNFDTESSSIWDLKWQEEGQKNHMTPKTLVYFSIPRTEIKTTCILTQGRALHALYFIKPY